MKMLWEPWQWLAVANFILAALFGVFQVLRARSQSPAAAHERDEVELRDSLGEVLRAGRAQEGASVEITFGPGSRRAVARTNDGRTRTVSLTPSGVRALAAWLAEDRGSGA